MTYESSPTPGNEPNSNQPDIDRTRASVRNVNQARRKPAQQIQARNHLDVHRSKYETHRVQRESARETDSRRSHASELGPSESPTFQASEDERRKRTQNMVHEQRRASARTYTSQDYVAEQQEYEQRSKERQRNGELSSEQRRKRAQERRAQVTKADAARANQERDMERERSEAYKRWVAATPDERARINPHRQLGSESASSTGERRRIEANRAETHIGVAYQGTAAQGGEAVYSDTVTYENPSTSPSEDHQAGRFDEANPELDEYRTISDDYDDRPYEDPASVADQRFANAGADAHSRSEEAYSRSANAHPRSAEAPSPSHTSDVSNTGEWRMPSEPPSELPYERMAASSDSSANRSRAEQQAVADGRYRNADKQSASDSRYRTIDPSVFETGSESSETDAAQYPNAPKNARGRNTARPNPEPRNGSSQSRPATGKRHPNPSQGLDGHTTRRQQSQDARLQEPQSARSQRSQGAWRQAKGTGKQPQKQAYAQRNMGPSSGDAGHVALSPVMALELAAPHTWVAAVMPTLVALCAAAANTGRLPLVASFVCLLIVILMQSAVNTINDYYDYVKGADSADDNVDPTDAVLVYNNVNPKAALGLAIGEIVAAFLLGVYIIVVCGLIPLIIALVGAAFVFLYSAGKTPISYLPLGELTSGIVMGGLIPLAVYMAASGTFSWLALLYAVPEIIGVGLIMMTNNTCDIERDVAATRHTLPTLLGRSRARSLYHALVIIWLIAITLITAGFFSQGIFVVPFMLLAAFAPLRALLKNPLNQQARIQAMGQICSVNVILGAFYCACILAGGFIVTTI